MHAMAQHHTKIECPQQSRHLYSKTSKFWVFYYNAKEPLGFPVGNQTANFLHLDLIV